MESISDVVQHKRMQILDNILAKTNCKNFGLNYAPTTPTNLGKQNSLLTKMEEGKYPNFGLILNNFLRQIIGDWL